MDVTFETPRGRRFTVEVGYFDTVLDMKEKVERQEQIAVAAQRLVFEGQELLDGGNTERYAILQGSRVLLLPPPPPDGFPWGVRVVVADPVSRRQFSLDVDALDTVARLKERVQECAKSGVLPAARQAMFCGCAEMRDHLLLADYDPRRQGHMEVCVVVRHPPTEAGNDDEGSNKKQLRMPVVVRYGLQAATVEVNAADNVGELRKELRQPPSEGGYYIIYGQVLRGTTALRPPRDGAYVFIYKQQIMDDSRSFRWHGIRSGETIDIFDGVVAQVAASPWVLKQ